jgi:hypothetical protein
MGNSESIFLARFATSQPFIMPRKLISVTSARYLVKRPFSKVTASLPDAAIAGFKTAITKSFFNDALNRFVVLNDHDHWQVLQRPNSKLRCVWEALSRAILVIRRVWFRVRHPAQAG